MTPKVRRIGKGDIHMSICVNNQNKNLISRKSKLRIKAKKKKKKPPEGIPKVSRRGILIYKKYCYVEHIILIGSSKSRPKQSCHLTNRRYPTTLLSEERVIVN